MDPFINQSNQGDQMDQDGKSWVENTYIGCLRHFVFVFALNQQKKKMKEKKKKKECHIVTPLWTCEDRPRIMIEFAMIT